MSSPPEEQPAKARLLHGLGPEITVPDWSEENPPTPDQWLDWFDRQTREARLIIVAFHLDLDNQARLRW